MRRTTLKIKPSKIKKQKKSFWTKKLSFRLVYLWQSISSSHAVTQVTTLVDSFATAVEVRAGHILCMSRNLTCAKLTTGDLLLTKLLISIYKAYRKALGRAREDTWGAKQKHAPKSKQIPPTRFTNREKQHVLVNPLNYYEQINHIPNTSPPTIRSFITS